MITYHATDQGDKALFSIIIPTWNNLSFLRLCVESIRKNSRFKHQIILHINDGSDGSREWAEAQHIDYTFSSNNVGVCFAVNAAFSLARTDYIVYLNDDMYVCPDWDYYLWEEISKTDGNNWFYSSTVIEPKLIGNKSSIAPYSFGSSPDDFEESRLLETFSTIGVDDWNGASWPPNIVHRSLWELVGGYSTEFFPGFYSDPDFSMKLWRAGVRNFKGIAESKVYHFFEVSTNRHKKDIVRNASLLFLRKWGITASMFYAYYLRMGTRYEGSLPEPCMDLSYRLKHLRCRLKRMLT